MYFNTYVINLDSQKKRYEVQEKKLNEVGIYPTRISGYMYDDISEIEIKKHFDFIFGVDSFASRSAIGCTYSHIQALKYFLDNDPYNVALIMEDDAFPLFTNVAHLEKKLDNIDWDYLSLHCDGICPKTKDKNTKYSGSTAAYFITREGAQKIINHKHSTHIDMETNGIKNLNKKVDYKNSFWTDEDNIMGGEISTNRYKRYCPQIVEDLTKYLYNRGEKTICHTKDYGIIRIPIIGYNVTNGDVFFIQTVILLIILWIVVRRLNKLKKV